MTLRSTQYQESFWRLKGGRCVRLTTLPPPVRRLSRGNVGASTSHNPMGLHSPLHVLVTLPLGKGLWNRGSWAQEPIWTSWYTCPCLESNLSLLARSQTRNIDRMKSVEQLWVCASCWRGHRTRIPHPPVWRTLIGQKNKPFYFSKENLFKLNAKGVFIKMFLIEKLLMKSSQLIAFWIQ
jgi:hypothetical protein